jgi:ADP-ribosylglycohydrolase
MSSPLSSHPRLPADHAARLVRARVALDGLSVGDALGQQFVTPAGRRLLAGEERRVPPGPWPYSDDTVMALGLVEVLARHGQVEPAELAVAFAGRGFTCHGAAVRVAPLGAYFADDLTAVADQARRSAEVTHTPPEGVACAIAAAVAAAVAWRLRGRAGEPAARAELFAAVLDHTPPGETRRGLEHASLVTSELSVVAAARLLGNGTGLSAPDTLPFCLWAATRHLGDYAEAVWTAVTAGGDLDTNAAIIGGVVAMAGATVPGAWLAAREPLPAG